MLRPRFSGPHRTARGGSAVSGHTTASQSKAKGKGQSRGPALRAVHQQPTKQQWPAPSRPRASRPAARRPGSRQGRAHCPPQQRMPFQHAATPPHHTHVAPHAWPLEHAIAARHMPFLPITLTWHSTPHCSTPLPAPHPLAHPPTPPLPHRSWPPRPRGSPHRPPAV
jgi:hypothetical protein